MRRDPTNHLAICIATVVALLLPTANTVWAQWVPTAVEFQHDSLKRIGARGDNWCMTWADDDSLITSMDDGNWLEGDTNFSNHLYRIVGNPADFSRREIPRYPVFKFAEHGWFGYGVVSVDGTLFSCVSKCPKTSWSGPFRGFKLLKSPKNDPAWYRVNANRENTAGHRTLLDAKSGLHNSAEASEFFFFEQAGREYHGATAYPFSFCSFAQCGRDNTAARDDFIYVYSPEGSASNQLLLARVPKQKVGQKSEWMFFTGMSGGQPIWSKELDDRKPVMLFPESNQDGEHFGWYSWLPSVVWNEGLGLFIMANGGTYAGHGLSDSRKDYYDAWMHTKSGSLGFWYASKPWGPWRQFFYDEQWVVDDSANRTYQPKLSPKWISDDGRTMTLVWSDAMKNKQTGRSHADNYLWNQMQITIK